MRKKNLVFILDVHGNVSEDFDYQRWFERIKGLINHASEKFGKNSIVLVEGIPYGKSIEDYCAEEGRKIIWNSIGEVLRKYLPRECFECILSNVGEEDKSIGEIGRGNHKIFCANPVWEILNEKFPKNVGWDDLELLGKCAAIMVIYLYPPPCMRAGDFGYFLQKVGGENLIKMYGIFYECARKRDEHLIRAIEEFPGNHQNIIVCCGGLHGAVGLLFKDKFNVIYLGVDKYVKKIVNKMLFGYERIFLEDYQIKFLEKILSGEIK